MKYHRRRTIEALQFDGSPRRAKRIASWVSKRDPSGTVTYRFDKRRKVVGPVIVESRVYPENGAVNTLYSGDWVEHLRRRLRPVSQAVRGGMMVVQEGEEMTRARLVELLADFVAHGCESYRDLLKIAMGPLPDEYVFERVRQEAPEILVRFSLRRAGHFYQWNAIDFLDRTVSKTKN